MSNHPLPVAWPPNAIFTVGHSTLTTEAFIALLKTYGIEQLADIRTMPRSHYNPQFNGDALAESLASTGIRYVHLKALGGLRKSRVGSPNTGWRNGGFRGYADYMLTDEFQQALASLIERSEVGCLAIMCAEVVPWRCHRLLVADALTVRGISVVEILSKDSYRTHPLTSFAEVDGVRIIYPSDQMTLFS